MKTKTILQIHTAQQLIGKTITWTAPGSRENGPYKGLAKIISVDPANRRPITSQTIEGDSLDFAFVNQYEKEDVEMGLLSYSDGYRYVTFEVKCTLIEEVIEKHWNNEAFLYYYESKKREFFDAELRGILESEGVVNPFDTLDDLRTFALYQKSNICKNA